MVARMGIPNLLTILRILLTPFFISFLLKGFWIYALFFLIFITLTDILDGIIARFFNQASKIGAYLDPLADKLFVSASCIALAYLGNLPLWLVAISVTRDFLMFLGGLYLFFKSLQIMPTLLSKINTDLHILLIFIIITIRFYPGFHSILPLLIIIVPLSAITSFLHYLYKSINLLRVRSKI